MIEKRYVSKVEAKQIPYKVASASHSSWYTDPHWQRQNIFVHQLCYEALKAG